MELQKINFGLLLAFDALHRLGSAKAAASSLGISQPAFSARLANLRELFGDPLFVQSGRLLKPTPKADELQPQLAPLIAELESILMRQAAFDPETAEGIFKVSATETIQAMVLDNLSTSFMQASKHMTLALIPCDPATTWQRLAANEIDASLVSSDFEPAEAMRRKLFEDRFVLAQRQGHPRGSAMPTIKTLCDYPHLVLSPMGGGLRTPSDDIIETQGYQRDVRISVSNTASALNALRETNLLAILPQRAIEYTDWVEAFPLPFDLPEVAIFLMWHKRRQHDPKHIWFRELAFSSML